MLWKWIEKKCIELKRYKAAAIAKDIQSSFEELYGIDGRKFFTKEMEMEHNKVFSTYEFDRDKIDYIEFVSRIFTHYIGCRIDKCCEKCRFAIDNGECREKDSLYDMFKEELLYGLL
ncbi:MAG: hypothetical protein ACE5KT_09865 [Methanosarcinales archaeon]